MALLGSLSSGSAQRAVAVRASNKVKILMRINPPFAESIFIAYF